MVKIRKTEKRCNCWIVKRKQYYGVSIRFYKFSKIKRSNHKKTLIEILRHISFQIMGFLRKILKAYFLIVLRKILKRESILII